MLSDREGRRARSARAIHRRRRSHLIHTDGVLGSQAHVVRRGAVRTGNGGCRDNAAVRPGDRETDVRTGRWCGAGQDGRGDSHGLIARIARLIRRNLRGERRRHDVGRRGCRGLRRIGAAGRGCRHGVGTGERRDG